MKMLPLLMTGLAALMSAPPAAAWSSHALVTYPALAVLPEVAKRPAVPAEPLVAFLAAESTGLAKLLQDEEAWARQHVPNYPARPDALAFDGQGASPDELLRRFVAALRINPQSRLTLFLQLTPGRPADARPPLDEAAVSPLKTKESSKTARFIALRSGEMVPVVDVIATASDEPDYGLDIGIWADNGTPHGAAYGFGKQPFGNPALEFSSQAPMHIGFFHEAGIIYKAAPFLNRTFPEYRIHLYRALASYALRNGHPYWGWRFAGWALHYIQDLTQPYHARVLPGVGVARTLGINALDMVGVHGPKERALTFVSNRHLALENVQLRWLLAAQPAEGAPPGAGETALQALRDTRRDASMPRYADDSPRQVVAREAHALADATDEAVVAALPAKVTSDPAYTFGVTESGLDLHAELQRSPPAARAQLEGIVTTLLGRAGAHTRSFIRALAEAAR